MRTYGTDKPDLRYGLEIEDATALTRDSQFGVFANAPVVRYITAPRAFSRAELGSKRSRRRGKGLAYLVNDGGEIRSPIAKFLSEPELEAFRSEPGTTVLFAAGDEALVSRVLGGLRAHLGRELGLAEGAADAFHWVIDFPLFERDEDTGRWTFLHHPFTAAVPGDEDRIESDPGGVLGQHYDLVWRYWFGSGPDPVNAQRSSRAFSGSRASRDERRSGGSASMPFGWAHRRTAASRWEWIASWPSWPASLTFGR
jgi:aspartyl-tRNA synthetase